MQNNISLYRRNKAHDSHMTGHVTNPYSIIGLLFVGENVLTDLQLSKRRVYITIMIEFVRSKSSLAWSTSSGRNPDLFVI